MFAFLAVWIGVAALVCSLLMATVDRLFNDVMVVVTLYTGIFSMFFAGMTLWSVRKEPAAEQGVSARRVQSWTGITLSLIATAIVYISVAGQN
jgi:hypothetical protein